MRNKARTIFFLSISLLLSISSTCTLSLSAQSFQHETDLYGTLNTPFRKIRKGTNVHVTSVQFFSKNDKNACALYRMVDHFELTLNDKITTVKNLRYYKNSIDFNCVTPQNVWDAAVINGLLDELNSQGFRNNQRHEMEIRSKRYIKLLKEHSLLFDEPNLTRYIQSLAEKLIPTYLVDGRSFNLNVMLLQNPGADAYMMPDGTLLISTGLLTLIHTPDELAAILARETAHLVLDHAMHNYHKSHFKMIVLGAVTTLVTDVINSFTPLSISPGTEYYSPGTLTSSEVSIVDGMMTSATNELGLGYDTEQDAAADLVAKEVLRTSGFDTCALSSLFYRLSEMMNTDCRFVRTLSKYGPKDVLIRSEKAGNASALDSDHEYEKIISAAVTTQSQIMYNEHHFRVAEKLSRQNFYNSIWSDDDCLILASALLAQYDDSTSVMEALALTNAAMDMRKENIQAYRLKTLALIRLGRNIDAFNTLDEYEKALQVFLASKDNIKSQLMWEPHYEYIVKETGWIRRTRAQLLEKPF